MIRFLRGLAALTHCLFARDTASPDLARERLLVCLRCPFHDQIAPNGLAVLYATLYVHRHPRHPDTGLGASHCRLCGCALTLKVMLPQRLIRRYTPQELVNMSPEFCWLRHQPGT